MESLKWWIITIPSNSRPISRYQDYFTIALTMEWEISVQIGTDMGLILPKFTSYVATWISITLRLPNIVGSSNINTKSAEIILVGPKSVW